MTGPLYQRLLGTGWSDLPGAIRAVHSADARPVRAHGRLRIAHGESRRARILARLLRLPRARAAADTRLTITPNGSGEHWLRTFDGDRLVTSQRAGDDNALIERFGAIELTFDLVASTGSLVYLQRGAALRLGPLRVPMPAAWAPRVEAREQAVGPRTVHVHVDVQVPGIGRLLTYDGTISVEDMTA